jgi:hypothetical protein|tara:strand:- start:200 stop:433 length:234 start_codon:yes stop_codon:yes gene_type:complete
MVDLSNKTFNPELALEIYNSVKARAIQDNIHLVDFAAALITCSKVILREELGQKEAEILFDLINKSWIVEKTDVTLH